MRKRLVAYLVLSQVGIFSLFIPTHVSARHPDLYALVKHELAAGQTVKLTKRTQYGGTKISNLPSYVFSGQVGTQFAVGAVRLVVITERDLNHPVLPVERQVRWAGILGSADDGQHWYKFFTIRDPKDPDTKRPQFTDGTIHHNVVGIFSKQRTLYIDVANDRGGGSGEGALRRLVSWDGGKSQAIGQCYYLNFETYQKKGKIFPDSLKRDSYCTYPRP